MASTHHSDARVAELRSQGRVFMREEYPFGTYPTYRVLDADGRQVGVEWHGSDVDTVTGERIALTFHTERELVAHVLDVWRPHDQAGQSYYCRLNAQYQAGHTTFG